MHCCSDCIGLPGLLLGMRGWPSFGPLEFVLMGVRGAAPGGGIMAMAAWASWSMAWPRAGTPIESVSSSKWYSMYSRLVTKV